jgi:hypothetical protein
MSKNKQFAPWERATLAFMIATCVLQPAHAGTQGSFMNSAGVGVAVDNVTTVSTYGTYSIKKSSPNGANPCAAINLQSGFTCANTAGLPPYTSRQVYCQSVGYPNYQWIVAANAVNGSTCDNPPLEQRLRELDPSFGPEDCQASIDLQTQLLRTRNVIQVSGSATAGAGAAITGYLINPGLYQQMLEEGGVPEDYGGTPVINQLLKGPFSYSSEECNLLEIPLDDIDLEQLILQVDTVALTDPFLVSCPDAVFVCETDLNYPDVEVISGWCAPAPGVTLVASYDPPESALQPGVPTEVTATVYERYADGTLVEKAGCTFTATRCCFAFEGFYAPINAVGGDCANPKYTARLGSVIPVKFKTTCGGAPYTSGNPPMFRVLRCSNGAPSGDPIAIEVVKFVAGEWHGNWDTSELVGNNANKGVYQLIVTLQNGEERSVFIKLR